MPHSRLKTFDRPRGSGSRDLRQLLNASVDEHSIHLALVSHLAHRATPRVFWTHVPAGEKRPPGVGGKLKGMGLKPGLPDFMLIVGGRPHFLELKRIGSKPSDKQIATMSELGAAGAVVGVAYGLDEALRILSDWGAIR